MIGLNITSLFSSPPPHNLPVQHDNLIPFVTHTQYSIEPLLLIGCLLYVMCAYIVILYRTWPEITNQLKYSLYLRNANTSTSLRRERKNKKWPNSGLFITASIVCFALFLYQLYFYPSALSFNIVDVERANMLESYSVKYILYFGCFAVAFHPLKWVYMYIVSTTFKDYSFGFTVIKLDVLYTALWTFVVFPLILVSFKTPEEVSSLLLLAVWTIYVVMILYKAIKIAFVGQSIAKFSYLHNFLYICTLETPPFLCLYVLLYNVMT